MESQKQLIKNILIRFVSAYLGCILIGLIFYQLNIFDAKSWAFEFILYGAITAIFFALLQTTTIRNAGAVYVVLIIIGQAVFPKPYDATFSLFWNILEYVVIGVVVYIYWRYTFSEGIKGIRPFLLAVYFMIAWVLISVVLRIYTNWYDGIAALIFSNARHGLIFGFGLGAGIETGDLLLKQDNTEIKET
jgi:hypothetical protein